MKLIASLPGREIYWLPDTQPASYFIRDKDAGGILVNAPVFSEELLKKMQELGGVKFVFLPSRFGAAYVNEWREKAGVESMAYEPEIPFIDATIDVTIDKKTRLTRTIGFLPMSGRTVGSCALHLRNIPGAIFFGPILTPGEDGWPTLIASDDDESFENRMFGVLGLQDVKYAYAFTDVFDEHTQYGPDADQAIARALEKALDL